MRLTDSEFDSKPPGRRCGYRKTCHPKTKSGVLFCLFGMLALGAIIAVLTLMIVFSVPPTGCKTIEMPTVWSERGEYVQLRQQLFLRNFNGSEEQDIFAQVWVPWINVRQTIYLVDQNGTAVGDAYKKIVTIVPQLRISLSFDDGEMCGFRPYATMRGELFSFPLRKYVIDVVNPPFKDWDNATTVAESGAIIATQPTVFFQNIKDTTVNIAVATKPAFCTLKCVWCCEFILCVWRMCVMYSVFALFYVLIFYCSAQSCLGGAN